MPVARLHLITTDVSATDASAVVARARLALDAGAPSIQVRSKSTNDTARLELARALVVECARTGATCLIDDRADIALAVGAAGVHVGADDLPVAVVRSLLGPDAIIGATCRDAEQARRAADAGASYLGVGPVYPTTTKAGLPDPIGLAGLSAVTNAVDLPVIAISGITVARVAEVMAAGAHGVAVVAAIFGAADVGAATRAFLDAIEANGGTPASGATAEISAGRAMGAAAEIGVIGRIRPTDATGAMRTTRGVDAIDGATTAEVGR